MLPPAVKGRDFAHERVRAHVVPPPQLRLQSELLPDLELERQRLVVHFHPLMGSGGCVVEQYDIKLRPAIISSQREGGCAHLPPASVLVSLGPHTSSLVEVKPC